MMGAAGVKCGISMAFWEFGTVLSPLCSKFALLSFLSCCLRDEFAGASVARRAQFAVCHVIKNQRYINLLTCLNGVGFC
jgi:hypothetical protein